MVNALYMFTYKPRLTFLPSPNMNFLRTFLELLMCYLQAAGNAVKRASDSLVRAAQKAAFNKADDNNVVVKTRFVGGIAQVRLQAEFYIWLTQ